jgi:hypothetical protein
VAPSEENPRGSSAALWMLSLAIGCLVLAAWLASLLWGGINSDAGYYIPQTLMVLGGDRPYLDFPSSYPPGIYYLAGLLGESGLRSPLVIKSCILVVQMANTTLVYGLLRRLGHDRPLAAFFSATFAGLTTAAWGMAFELEPFQNFFILLAFWILLRPALVWRGVIVGLLLGSAVLVKQYAILAIPPLLLASITPIYSCATAKPDLHGRHRHQIVGLLCALPVPYLLFVGLTDVDLIENVVHLSTFGGQASTYGVSGLAGLFDVASFGSVGRFLLPTWLLAVWLMLRHTSWRAGLLVLGLALGSAPLYVRPFEYYFQMALPWSILVMAEFSRAVGSRMGSASSVRTLVAVLIVLPLLGIIWDGARKPLLTRDRGAAQAELASRLESEIEVSEDVLVLGGASWVYVITRFVPPLKDYSFYLNTEIDVPRRANARFVIVFGGGPNDARLLAWLQEDGMRLRNRLRWLLGIVYILERPPPPTNAEPLGFGRSTPR